MPEMLKSLAEICSKYKLNRKYLIDPGGRLSRNIGYSLVHAGISFANLHPCTIPDIARGIVEDSILGQGGRIVSNKEMQYVIEEIIGSIDPAYFGPLLSQPGIVAEICSAIVGLREHYISSAHLREECFHTKEKCADIRNILSRVEQYLEENRVFDEPRIVEQAETRQSYAREKSVYIILEGAMYNPRYLRFLKGIAGRNLKTIPFLSSGNIKHDLSRDTVKAGSGISSEVAGILRIALRDRIPLDDIEIITVNRNDALSVFTLAQSEGIAVTMGTGYPVIFTETGKLVSLVMEYIKSGYESGYIFQMCIEGFIRGIKDAAPLVRRAGPVRGVEDLIKRLKEHSKHDEHSLGNALVTFLKRVGRIMPQGNPVSVNRLFDIALDFLSQAEIKDEAGLQGLYQITDIAQKKISLFEKELPLPEAVQRASDEMLSLIVGAQSPRPGAIHVTNYLYAGFPPRKKPFFIGLDSRKFPVEFKDNPVLLSTEKTRISPDLVLPHQERDYSLHRFYAAADRFGTEITFSCSLYDPVGNKRIYPSPFFLHIASLVYGVQSLDFEELDKRLSRNPWLPVDIGQIRSLSVSANLHKGLDALEKREGENFTGFDGYVNADLDAYHVINDPKNPVSVTRLETLSQCPFLYYLKNILRLRPLEELAVDDTVWLDRLEAGTILHEVFRDIMSGIAEGSEGITRKHVSVAKKMIEKRLKEKAGSNPPSSQPLYDEMENEMKVTVERFVQHEIEKKETIEPLYFEWGFNPDKMTGEKSLDHPVEIALDKKNRIYVKGIIDRVNRLHDEEGYEVIDYKTGSSSGYEEGKPFAGGLHIQHAVYGLALEGILKETGQEKEPVIRQSGYFFPSERGKSREVLYPFEKDNLCALLSMLGMIVEQGTFIPLYTKSRKTRCRYCDFRPVCDISCRTDRIEKKMEKNAEGVLKYVHGVIAYE